MADNLGFAIPVTYVKDFLRNREAFSFDKNNPNTGYRYLDPPRRLRAGSPQGLIPSRESRQPQSGADRRVQWFCGWAANEPLKSHELWICRSQPAATNPKRVTVSLWWLGVRPVEQETSSPVTVGDVPGSELGQPVTPLTRCVGGEFPFPRPVSRGVPGMECSVMRIAKRAILRLALVGWLGPGRFFRTDGEPRPGRDPPGEGPPRLDRCLRQADRHHGAARGVPPEPVRPALERPGIKDWRDEIAGKLKDRARPQGKDRRHAPRAVRAASRATWRLPHVSQDDPKSRLLLAHRRRRQEHRENDRGPDPSTKQAEAAGSKIPPKPSRA